MIRDDVQHFVAVHHRHNRRPKGAIFFVGVADELDQLRGVAVVGRPVARELDDGLTLEVTRCCTDGARNAASMLYGRALRIARLLGYRRVFTYTLQSEPGSSVRAAGFRLDAELPARPTERRPEQLGLGLGELPSRPEEAKRRWVFEL